MPGSPVVDIRNSYGAMFVGVFVSTMLFGLEAVQAWTYFWYCWNKDRKAFKFFVGFLILIDTMSTIMSFYTVYWYLVLNFGNVENLALRVWSINIQPLFSAIPSAAVQLYYARRVYLVSQSIICPVIVVPLVIGSTTFGYYIGIKVITLTKYHTVVANWLTCLAMASNVFGDIVITVTMCWTLYRKKTGFARTDSMIMTLMSYTIHSGLLLSALGSAQTISFAVAPTNMVWEAFFLVMSKSYMNSLLFMLNTREAIRDRSTSDKPDTGYSIASIRLEPPSEAYGSKPRQRGLTVTVQHSTVSDSDDTTRPPYEESKSGVAELA